MILLHDNYDIWQVDPWGRKPAKNITNGYGRKNYLKLRLSYELRNATSPLREGDLIYHSLSPITKHNGFFWKYWEPKLTRSH